MSDNSDFGAFLVGFVVGGLTGAAVSLLFAPQSGEETRAILRDKAVELRDRAAESVEEARLQAEKAWDEAKLKTDEWTKIAKEKAGELRTKGEKSIEDSRQKIAETINPKEKTASEG